MRIHDLPIEERPRELLVQRGAENLSNAQLLAILLRTGTKGASVLNVAQQLLAKFNGSLRSLVEARVEELTEINGIGRDKAVTLKAAFTLARRMSEETRREQPLLNTPEKVVEVIKDEFVNCPVETLWVVLLNTRKRLIKFEKVVDGILDTIIIHPREVFCKAIIARAASVILVHNHPSGDPTPSDGDIRTTRELIRAGQILKIELVDHIIIGSKTDSRDAFVSLRALGYFPN
ncbi:MAG: RadC family protein [Verrucomicrobiia bacterium]